MIVLHSCYLMDHVSHSLLCNGYKETDLQCLVVRHFHTKLSQLSKLDIEFEYNSSIGHVSFKLENLYAKEKLSIRREIKNEIQT